MFVLKNKKKIILHTAAFRSPCDAQIIKQWHLEKGYLDIGYHFVITGSIWDRSAEVQMGRSLNFQGAHAYLSNKDSIGICVTGHGDHIEWTEEQIKLTASLVQILMKKYDIPIKKVIGHRDTPFEKLNLFKTCPGKLVDMEEIRKLIMSFNEVFKNVDVSTINLQPGFGKAIEYFT